jgi:hypothetical protein
MRIVKARVADDSLGMCEREAQRQEFGLTLRSPHRTLLRPGARCVKHRQDHRRQVYQKFYQPERPKPFGLRAVAAVRV